MKPIFCLLISISLVGCATSTEYGRCVGALDPQDENLQYEINDGNLFWGIAASLIVPGSAGKQIYCPVSKK